MAFESYNDFAKTLDGALGGNRAAQGRLKDAIMEADRRADGGTALKEAVTSDMLAPWFTQAVAPAFEQAYDDQPQTWKEFASEELLNDFRPTQLLSLDHDVDATLLQDNGGAVVPSGTLPHVPELTPYPTFGYKASGRWIDTSKFGARLHFSWEAFINDDWSMLERFPSDAALLAARTIDAAVYGALWSLDPNAPGFNPGVVSDELGSVLQARTADGVLLTGDVPKNAPLSYDSLKAAIQQVAETKVDGRYVTVPSFVLIVPPALENLANMVVNTRTVEREVPVVGGAAGEVYRYVEENGLASRIKVVVSDFPAILGGAAQGQTNWILAPAGGKTGAKRTIIRTALRGYDKPELRVKNAGGLYLGGGEVPYTEGSFDNDDAQARVRLTTGAGVLHTDGIVASTGLGK